MNDTKNLTIPTDFELTRTYRTVMGGILQFLTLVFLLIYSHVFYVLLSRKLWRIHSFFLWFVSLSVCDMANLLIYLWGSINVLKNYNLLSYFTNIIIGHVYNFFFLIGFFHFPFMATVRTGGIAFPIRCRQWLTAKWTVAEICIAWILGVLLTAYAQKSKGNWVYYDPDIIGWNLAFGELYDSELDAFWIAMPSLSVGISLFMYAICVYKLRKHTNQIMDSNLIHAPAGDQAGQQAGQQPHSAEAERNLIKINIMLVLVFTLDMIFWRVQTESNKAWWTPFALTIVEVVMYGVNAIVLLGVSREIRRRSSLCHFISRCRCHIFHGNDVHALPGEGGLGDGGATPNGVRMRAFPPVINLLVEKWSHRSVKLQTSGGSRNNQV